MKNQINKDENKISKKKKRKEKLKNKRKLKIKSNSKKKKTKLKINKGNKIKKQLVLTHPGPKLQFEKIKKKN